MGKMEDDVDFYFVEFLICNMKIAKEKEQVTGPEMKAFASTTPLDDQTKLSLRDLMSSWKFADRIGLKKTLERINGLEKSAVVKRKKQIDILRQGEREKINSIVRTFEFNDDLRYITFPLFPDEDAAPKKEIQQQPVIEKGKRPIPEEKENNMPEKKKLKLTTPELIMKHHQPEMIKEVPWKPLMIGFNEQGKNKSNAAADPQCFDPMFPNYCRFLHSGRHIRDRQFSILPDLNNVY